VCVGGGGALACQGGTMHQRSGHCSCMLCRRVSHVVQPAHHHALCMYMHLLHLLLQRG
jgi:hypothetical protein